jgi:hypothetical protein
LSIVNNVIINYFIFLKGVRIDLFPPPPKPSGCDFKQWIDDYMTPNDRVCDMGKEECGHEQGCAKQQVVLSVVLYR